MAIEKVILATPRGFCAGVEMAIETVERALQRHGPPLYVFHEIVHNLHVVREFTDRGVRFVQSVDKVPDGAKLIFSAHGIAPAVWEQAKKKNLQVIIDATCPLVEKVHREVRKFAAQGYWIILVGHVLQVLRSTSMSSIGLQRLLIAQITWSISVGSISSSTAMIHLV